MLTPSCWEKQVEPIIRHEDRSLLVGKQPLPLASEKPLPQAPDPPWKQQRVSAWRGRGSSDSEDEVESWAGARWEGVDLWPKELELEFAGERLLWKG